MNKTTVIMLNCNAIVLLLFLITTPAEAADKQVMPPGSYFNPWVITKTEDGTRVQAKEFTGGNSLAPGNIFNPYTVKETGKGEYEVRPEFPWGQDNK
jgi:hypothetical protein